MNKIKFDEAIYYIPVSIKDKLELARIIVNKARINKMSIKKVAISEILKRFTIAELCHELKE